MTALCILSLCSVMFGSWCFLLSRDNLDGFEALRFFHRHFHENIVYVCFLAWTCQNSGHIAYTELPGFALQVFNEISSREMEQINVFKGILNNYVFVSVLGVTVIFQIIIVEFLGTFANTTPLTLSQWLACISIGFLGMPIAAVFKMIPVWTSNHSKRPMFRNLSKENPSSQK